MMFAGDTLTVEENLEVDNYWLEELIMLALEGKGLKISGSKTEFI